MNETIVMIHGMWGGSWCWDNYRTFYENKGYRCITPTLRYHDVNPKDGPDPRLGTVSLIDYADDLESLIRKLDPPVILMGSSMGGLIAQILASRNVANALVLLAPASPYGIMALTPSVIKSFWSSLKTWGFWKKPMRQTFEEASYSTLGLLPTNKKIKAYNRFVYESGRAASEIGFWYLDHKKASMVDESKITCPVLIIAGNKDKITPPSVLRKIADKYKENAVYKEFENHGHWIIGEPGWEKIADYSSRWLRNVLDVNSYEVKPLTEKRQYKRIQHHALIAFSTPDSDLIYQGELGNYSQGGLHFRSTVAIHPGSEIDIKLIEDVPIVFNVKGKDARNVEVMWYKQRKDDFTYDIGAKFSENPRSIAALP